MPRRSNRLVLLLALAGAVTVSGCIATSGVRAGQQAETAQDYDQAVIEYTKALHAKPGDTHLRQDLDRAKLRASQDHLTRGRRLAANGRLEESVIELQTA